MFGFHGYYQARNLSIRRAKRKSVFGKWPYRKSASAHSPEPKTTRRKSSYSALRKFADVFRFHKKREFRRIAATLLITSAIIATIAFWIGPRFLEFLKYIS